MVYSKRCPNCGFLNPQFKFCGECGQALSGFGDSSYLKVDSTAVSAAIGVANPTHHKEPVALPQEAERRQLTVLFCDIVDSTAFTEKLDPEDLRNLLEAYRTCVMEVVFAQNGHIARYFGDGILVYFGYPIAHEDAAHRAVRAALEIVAALETLNPYLHATFGVEINVRLSIDTGLVVVWQMAEEDSPEAIDIVGKTPNLAARMQKLATPNSILIGNTTHQLIEGFFRCNALGTSALRGISQPVPVYQVSGEIPAQSRIDVALSSGLTPLIGREQEVQLLQQQWTEVLNAKGQALLIEGEAGIGKSRCVQLIKEYVHSGVVLAAQEPSYVEKTPLMESRKKSEEKAHVMECRCSPYYQNSPLYPILSVFQQHLLQFTNTDTSETQLSKIDNFLRDSGIPTTTLPFLAELLEIPFEKQTQHEPEEAPTGNRQTHAYPSGWTRRQRRQQLEMLVQVLLTVAERKPMLFVVEDLHWMDPSSIEFMTLLITRLRNARIFTVLTCRSDLRYGLARYALSRENLEGLLRPQWATALTLERLTSDQVETMIQRVAGDTPVPSNVLKQIAVRTAGVPLFVEELTRMMLEGNTLALDATDSSPQATEIPVTLQALLTARLDRLGPAKEIVQLGATLGREWTSELLLSVATSCNVQTAKTENATLSYQLNQLVAAHILNRNDTHDNQVIYTFRHPLIRETAYQSLLKSTRQEYHLQIATVLTRTFGTIAHTQPELVAYHYTEAGHLEKAIYYWQQAGHRALERSANVEGIRHLTQGLAALEKRKENSLPGESQSASTNVISENVISAGLAQLELELQTTLAPALITTKGYAAPEVEIAYTRARALLDTLDTTGNCRAVNSRRFPILFGLWLFYLVRGNLKKARELGEQCLVIAKQQENQAFEVEAHRALGATLYHMSEFKSALAHLETGLALYQPQQHPVTIFFHYVAEPGMTLLSYSAPLLWCLGYPTQAEKRLRKAATIAEDRNHPFSEAVSLHFTTLLYQYRGEVEKVDDYATQLLHLCQEHGFSVWESAAKVMKGWAMSEQNQLRQGIAMIRAGIAAWGTTRAEVLMPLFLALLAQAYQRAGKHRLALQTLDSAILVSTRTGERTYVAELYRRKGELCLPLDIEIENTNLGDKGVRANACDEEKGGGRNAAQPNQERTNACDEKKGVGLHSAQPNQEQAEDYFHKALASARGQSAKSWELRAAISLSELWMNQNRGEAAYNLLKSIYTWFSEGFDTPDLVSAKRLLNQLEANR